MQIDNEQAGKNSLSLLKMFLGIFIITYFFWYIGGGPERWNNKFEKVNKEVVQENLIGTEVFKMDK
jgi:TM2 domain-containing membrane protein YozV